MHKEEYTQQAFPNVWDSRHKPEFEPIDGMTLLDHFAGIAMNGLITDYPSTTPLDEIAGRAYAQAAAMMEERKKYLTPQTA